MRAIVLCTYCDAAGFTSVAADPAAAGVEEFSSEAEGGGNGYDLEMKLKSGSPSGKGVSFPRFVFILLITPNKQARVSSLDKVSNMKQVIHSHSFISCSLPVSSGMPRRKHSL